MGIGRVTIDGGIDSNPYALIPLGRLEDDYSNDSEIQLRYVLEINEWKKSQYGTALGSDVHSLCRRSSEG